MKDPKGISVILWCILHTFLFSHAIITSSSSDWRWLRSPTTPCIRRTTEDSDREVWTLDMGHTYNVTGINATLSNSNGRIPFAQISNLSALVGMEGFVSSSVSFSSVCNVTRHFKVQGMKQQYYFECNQGRGSIGRYLHLVLTPIYAQRQKTTLCELGFKEGLPQTMFLVREQSLDSRERITTRRPAEYSSQKPKNNVSEVILVHGRTTVPTPITTRRPVLTSITFTPRRNIVTTTPSTTTVDKWLAQGNNMISSGESRKTDSDDYLDWLDPASARKRLSTTPASRDRTTKKSSTSSDDWIDHNENHDKTTTPKTKTDVTTSTTILATTDNNDWDSHNNETRTGFFDNIPKPSKVVMGIIIGVLAAIGGILIAICVVLIILKRRNKRRGRRTPRFLAPGSPAYTAPLDGIDDPSSHEYYYIDLDEFKKSKKPTKV